MTKQLSASSVAHALRCSFPYRDGVRTIEQPSGKEARLGTEAHTGLELTLKAQPVDWKSMEFGDAAQRHVAQVVKWLVGHETVDHVERGVLYNTRTDTAEWGPRRGEPGYETTPPGCIRATLDFAWTRNALRVCDLKTGRVKDEHIIQLRTLGLAVARITGRTEVSVGAVYSRLTKVIEPKWEVMDEDALDAHAGLLHRLLRRLPVAEQNAGDQCVYCEVHPEECWFRTRQDEPFDNFNEETAA